MIPSFTNEINQYFDGNDFIAKEGYRYYKRNVNANETYKVTALTDGEVPFTFYLLDFNGDVLRKEVDCKETIIFIEQDGIMVINSSWKHSLNPIVNLMTYDDSKEIIAPRIFYCGKNRQFKKLKDCIEEATKYMDSVVYVDDGVYDLVSEFGTDYLDSYKGTDEIGIELKNRVHVIFSSGRRLCSIILGLMKRLKNIFLRLMLANMVIRLKMHGWKVRIVDILYMMKEQMLMTVIIIFINVVPLFMTVQMLLDGTHLRLLVAD